MVKEVEDLKKHIKKHLAKGYSIADIKNALLEAGFSKDSINKALIALGKKEEKKTFGWFAPKPPAPPKVKKPVVKPEIKKKPSKGFFGWLKPSPAQKPKKPVVKIKKPPKPKIKRQEIKKTRHPIKLRNQVAVLLLILFLVAIGIVIWLFPATCATEACFIRHANNCDAATYRNKIDGTVMSYQTNDCFIIKTVEKMDSDEPPVIREQFEGKSMTCSYNKGDFDPLYVNTISAHLNTCEGELREAIISVVV